MQTDCLRSYRITNLQYDVIYFTVKLYERYLDKKKYIFRPCYLKIRFKSSVQKFSIKAKSRHKGKLFKSY